MSGCTAKRKPHAAAAATRKRAGYNVCGCSNPKCTAAAAASKQFCPCCNSSMLGQSASGEGGVCSNNQCKEAPPKKAVKKEP